MITIEGIDNLTEVCVKHCVDCHLVKAEEFGAYFYVCNHPDAPEELKKVDALVDYCDGVKSGFPSECPLVNRAVLIYR